eukprot:1587408-Pleurochrysis_carterae.AAC.2
MLFELRHSRHSAECRKRRPRQACRGLKPALRAETGDRDQYGCNDGSKRARQSTREVRVRERARAGNGAEPCTQEPAAVNAPPSGTCLALSTMKRARSASCAATCFASTAAVYSCEGRDAKPRQQPRPSVCTLRAIAPRSPLARKELAATMTRVPL